MPPGASRQFALCSLPLLIGFFAAAIANVRRPELHKQLMYLVMVCLIIPAIARVFLVLLAPAGESVHRRSSYSSRRL